MDAFSDILSEPKFRAFSWSCAGDLMVLGVLESKGKPQISMQPQVLDFKSNQNIWLNILQDADDGTLSLKDLIVCEYKYTQVVANFILYPQLKDGQLLSTKSISFGQLLDQAPDYTGKAPLLKNHELFMTDDLTDNDIVIRQINVSHVIRRLLAKRL